MSRKREPETVATLVDPRPTPSGEKVADDRAEAFYRWSLDRAEAGRARGSCSLSDNCDMGRIWKPEDVDPNAFVLCAEHREQVEAAGKRTQKAEAARRLA